MDYQRVAEAISDFIQESSDKVEVVETNDEALIFISTNRKGAIQHDVVNKIVWWGTDGSLRTPPDLNRCSSGAMHMLACLRGVRQLRGNIRSLCQCFMDSQWSLGKEVTVMEAGDRVEVSLSPDSRLHADLVRGADLRCNLGCVPRWLRGQVSRSVDKWNPA